MNIVARLLLFAAMIVLWNVVSRADKAPWLSFLITVLPLALVMVVTVAGRRRLDRAPGSESAVRVTLAVHYLVLLLLGLALFEALSFYPRWPLWTIPIPRTATLIAVWVTGLALASTVINLAVRALGAPFAIGLSRRLATDWMYRYTRNPMGLATFCFLTSVALLTGSLSLLAWLLVIMLPVWIHFVRVYEEKELAERFGATYLEYRERTPFLWPGRPRA